MTLKFPTVPAAIQMHTHLIVKYGGKPGLKDRSYLESAIGNARNSFEMGYFADIIEVAAALMRSLGANHAFHT